MKNKKKTLNVGMIKNALFVPLFAALLFVNNLQAQESNDGIQKPKFPGGEQEMQQFLAKNVVYPEEAKKEGIQGSVMCRFLVDSTGEIQEVSVSRGLSPEIDKEAIRVVSAMPKWIPAKENGENIELYYTIPIQFMLPDNSNNNTSPNNNNTSNNNPSKLILNGIEIPLDAVIMLNGKIVPREELTKIPPDRIGSVSTPNSQYTSGYGGKSVYVIQTK